jgi:hypothetical protein
MRRRERMNYGEKGRYTLQDGIEPALQYPLHTLLADKNDLRLKIASAYSLLNPT